MNLGNSLFHARKKRGLSQEEVAEKLGVSRQTVSKWETDETIPDIRQAKKMAVLYNLPLDDLIAFDVDVKEIQEIIDKTRKRKKKSTGQRRGEESTRFWSVIKRRSMFPAMPGGWPPCWMNCGRSTRIVNRMRCWC